MDSDKIFSDGITFTPPHVSAPDFVIGRIGVSVEQFVTFLNDYKNEKGWVNLDLKKSKGGKFYFELNTWKKGDAPQKSAASPFSPKPVQTKIEYPDDGGGEVVGYTKDYTGDNDINPDDIPF